MKIPLTVYTMEIISILKTTMRHINVKYVDVVPVTMPVFCMFSDDAL